MNNTKRCKVYSSIYLRKYRQKLDSLDSFIDPVTISRGGNGPCSDVMGYITLTDM